MNEFYDWNWMDRLQRAGFVVSLEPWTHVVHPVARRPS